MGGPSTIAEVGDFLLNLFTDRDIIQLPFQRYFSQLFVVIKIYNLSFICHNVANSALGSPNGERLQFKRNIVKLEVDRRFSNGLGNK